MEKRLQNRLILACALILIGLRFLYPGIVQFISDEAIFQEWADQANREGGLRLVGMGGSSIPVAYGAGAVWLYQIPHMLSSNPLAFTLFHTTIYSFCFLFLYLTIGRFLDRTSATYALLAAASSPFLFFFSRHTWDTTFFVPFTAIMLFAYSHIVQQSKIAPWRLEWKRVWPFVVIAFFASLAINIQLAIGPFILLIFAALLFWLLKDERKNLAAWLAAFGCGVCVILFCLPYAIAAKSYMENNISALAQVTHPHWGDFRHFWWNILYSLFGLSVWKAGLFFQPIFVNFTHFSGPFLTKLFYLDPFGWCIKLLCLFMTLFLFFKIISGKFLRLTHFEFITISGLVIILLVFQYLNVPVQPHYFQSIWWVPFCLLALVFDWLKRKNIKGELLFKGIFLGLVFTNSAFLIFSLSFLKINGGTRGMHHSTGILETQKAIKTFCQQLSSNSAFSAGKEISIDISRIEMGNPPFEYFFKREPECINHTFKVSMTPLFNPDFYMEYIDKTGNNARYHAVPARLKK